MEQGVQPRVVWEALCDAMEVPDAVRWRHMDKPRRRPKAKP
ncbi:MAG: DUF3046 domain-containing protein [Bifidobacteriaceae bacterium]|nr:DUF3046 domain-containing protein [Bifidobacteriaceae bacterium]